MIRPIKAFFTRRWAQRVVRQGLVAEREVDGRTTLFLRDLSQEQVEALRVAYEKPNAKVVHPVGVGLPKRIASSKPDHDLSQLLNF